MTGTTLDAGALIELEAGSPYMRELIRVAFAERFPLAVPAGVLAQVWRECPAGTDRPPARLSAG